MSASLVATYAAAWDEIDAEARRRLRFGWAMKRPDGSVELEGMDYAEVDGDGRLTRIVGFFGALR